MDDLTTYVDLVSLIIEEDHEGLEKARQLAEKYGAEVVGAIPPLNTYQLRLPVKNLTERDAMVLRLGSEVGVDAVVIEESAAESDEQDKQERPRRQNREWAANRFDAVDYYRERIPDDQRAADRAPVRIGIIERAVDFDAPHFAEYLQPCDPRQQRTCLYARDADKPDNHGSSVAGILAAHASDARDQGFRLPGRHRPGLRGDRRAQLGRRHHRQCSGLGESGRRRRADSQLELGHPSHRHGGRGR